MGSSAIDAIRQAEKKADEVLSNASNEAERIRENARVQAADNDRAARTASENMAQSILDTAREMAEYRSAEARKELMQELAALDGQAQKNCSAAVEQILRVIGAR